MRCHKKLSLFISLYISIYINQPMVKNNWFQYISFSLKLQNLSMTLSEDLLYRLNRLLPSMHSDHALYCSNLWTSWNVSQPKGQVLHNVALSLFPSLSSHHSALLQPWWTALHSLSSTILFCHFHLLTPFLLQGLLSPLDLSGKGLSILLTQFESYLHQGQFPEPRGKLKGFFFPL